MERRGTTVGSGRAAALAACLALVALGGCEKQLDSGLEGPLSFEVSFVAGDAGTAEAPRPYSAEPASFAIDVRAIDLDGQAADWFNGPVSLGLAPVGDLAKGQALQLELVDGVASGVAVEVEEIHGSANIWVEDRGTDDAPGSYATGLSPEIWVSNPTIRQMQQGGHHETSALRGDFVEIAVAGRTVVVTGVTKDGFYATDVSEVDQIYNGLFVYSFSRPAVSLGDTLDQLSGTADEYYGFTELSFPSWKVGGTAELPEPVEITSTLLEDNELMEQHESTLVQAFEVTVCTPADEFSTYGQWAVLVDPDGDCSSGVGALNVVSTFTAPDFDPWEHVGTELVKIVGNLRYHMAATPRWLVYVRDAGDIVVAADD